MKLISNSAESDEETEDIGKAIKITQLGKETRGITIPIRINNISTKAAVDTGADAIVISEDVARDAKLDFETGTNCKLLNAANNAEMIAYGGVTATPQIGKRKWNWPVYVAPIRDGVLLGIDFLQGSDAKILTGQLDIVFGDQLVVGCLSGDTDFVNVVLGQDEEIPPKSEKAVIGRVTSPNPEVYMVLNPSCTREVVQIGLVFVRASSSIPVRILKSR